MDAWVPETFLGSLAMQLGCKTLAINSRLLSDKEYIKEKEQVENRLNLPAWDVLREGISGLVDETLKLRVQLGKG